MLTLVSCVKKSISVILHKEALFSAETSFSSCLEQIFWNYGALHPIPCTRFAQMVHFCFKRITLYFETSILVFNPKLPRWHKPKGRGSPPTSINYLLICAITFTLQGSTKMAAVTLWIVSMYRSNLRCQCFTAHCSNIKGPGYEIAFQLDLV